jgi:hypothetical protein
VVTVRLKVLQLIVVLPGEYTINGVSNQKPTSICHVTRETRDNIVITAFILL